MALFSIASYWNFMLRVEKIILNGFRKISGFTSSKFFSEISFDFSRF